MSATPLTPPYVTLSTSTDARRKTNVYHVSLLRSRIHTIHSKLAEYDADANLTPGKARRRDSLRLELDGLIAQLDTFLSSTTASSGASPYEVN